MGPVGVAVALGSVTVATGYASLGTMQQSYSEYVVMKSPHLSVHNIYLTVAVYIQT